jgi:hypothetical protein
MLTSPTQDANGYCNTFGPQDFASLKAYGANRSSATEVAKWLSSADEFMAAYGSRVDATDAVKSMNKFDIRCCMHVHGKKHETRASFKKLADIAAEWYTEMKQLDPLLPKWAMLPDDVLKSSASSTDKQSSILLRETGSAIDENLLSEKGFVIGRHVVQEATGHVYVLACLNADGVTATLSLVQAAEASKGTGRGRGGKSSKGSKGPRKNLEVSRAEILLGDAWYPRDKVEAQIMDPKKLALVQDCFDFKASVIVGEIKAKLAIEASRSHDTDMQLQISPIVSVLANKKFGKGSRKLYAISNGISIVKDDKAGLLGHKTQCQLYAGQGFKVYMKSTNDSLQHDLDRYTACMYWNVVSAFDQGAVNCEYDVKEIDISAMGIKLTLKVPYITNRVAIQVGDHLKALKVSDAAESVEPPTKKFKFGIGSSKKK